MNYNTLNRNGQFKPNYERISHQLMTRLCQKQENPLHQANQNHKQRIQNTLQSIEGTQRSQIMSNLQLQTQTLIVDRMKVLEPTQSNIHQIEKNIDKLVQMQQTLLNETGNWEIKQLLNKVQSKLLDQVTISSKAEDSKCQICFDKLKSYVAVPCGHYIYCSSCKDLIKDRCLMCQVKTTQVLKIYS